MLRINNSIGQHRANTSVYINQKGVDREMNILKIEKDPGDPSTDPLIKKFEEGWFVGKGGGVVRGNDRYDNGE